MAENSAGEVRDRAAAVVVAAGSGRRMGGMNKAMMPMAGVSLLSWSLRTLRATPAVAQVIVVMNEEDRASFRSQWTADPVDLGADLVVDGGAERWESSLLGLRAADEALPLLLVHDAARPMVQEEDFQEVLVQAEEHGAALLAEPLNDTLKRVDDDGMVLSTVPREALWRAATPQAARRELMLEAFERWPADAPPPTDESQLLEALGVRPKVVLARGFPLKVTRHSDHFLLEKLLGLSHHD